MVLAGTNTNYPDPQDGHPILDAYARHGIPLHNELALLVRAGHSPAEALAAATSVPARLFGLTDRGRIPPGCAPASRSSTATHAPRSPRPATSPGSGATALSCIPSPSRSRKLRD
jgi:hypothetical protein